MAVAETQCTDYHVSVSRQLRVEGPSLWDGLETSRRDGPHSLTIRDQVLDRIGESGAFGPASSGDRVHRFEPSATVLPGLIDCHVHMTLDPSLFRPADQLALAAGKVWAGMQHRALAMVQAGVTTARDLGAGSWMEVALRERIASGDVVGPRLLCAGQPLTTPEGHCHFWGGEVQGSEDFATVIDRQVAHEVDWIKVMATGGVFTKGTDVQKPQFDAAALREIVALAAGHGRSVAAHCHGTAGIRNAFEAGIRTVEHCSFAGKDGFGSDFDPDFVPHMVRDDVWVSPTVNFGWGRRREKDGKPTPFWERMTTCLRALRQEGVRLVASTDAGIPGVQHHQLPEALAVFADYAELSCVEALRTATSEAAAALGIGDRTGTLAPGRDADLVVVDGDPTRDLAALLRPLLVVARGRVVFEADWSPTAAA